MADYTTSRPAPFGAITSYRAIQAVSALLGSIARWNDARLTQKSLSALSDRELNDIGLCRGDIDLIARQRA